jgi:hypothetical protein
MEAINNGKSDKSHLHLNNHGFMVIFNDFHGVIIHHFHIFSWGELTSITGISGLELLGEHAL